MSDVMLLGVLRMPVPYPVDAMWLHQLVDRAGQAADRIEADAARIERLGLLLCELLEHRSSGDFCRLLEPKLLERWQAACDEHIAATTPSQVR